MKIKWTEAEQVKMIFNHRRRLQFDLEVFKPEEIFMWKLQGNGAQLVPSWWQWVVLQCCFVCNVLCSRALLSLNRPRNLRILFRNKKFEVISSSLLESGNILVAVHFFSKPCHIVGMRSFSSAEWSVRSCCAQCYCVCADGFESGQKNWRGTEVRQWDLTEIECVCVCFKRTVRRFLTRRLKPHE